MRLYGECRRTPKLLIRAKLTRTAGKPTEHIFFRSSRHDFFFILIITSVPVEKSLVNMSDQLKEIADIPRDFLRDGTLFLNRCTKRTFVVGLVGSVQDS